MFDLAQWMEKLGYEKFESTIALSTYNTDPAGRIINEHGIPFKEVVRRLEEETIKLTRVLKDQGHISEEMAGYFEGWTDMTAHDRDHVNKTFPTRYWGICAYAVRGGNEGHYAHVDIVRPHGPNNEQAIGLAISKTFGGMDHCLLLANIATVLFNGTR